VSRYPPPPHVPYASPYAQYQMPPQKRGRGYIGWFIFIALCIVLFITLNKNNAQYSLQSLSDVATQLEAGNVNRLIVEGDMIKVELRRPVTFPGRPQAVTLFKAEVPPGVTGNWAFSEWLLAKRNGATIVAENSQNVLLSIIVPLIPWLLIFGFIWFFVFRQLRGGMGQANLARPVYIVPPPPPMSGAPTAPAPQPPADRPPG
jgi:ATP-dependent Zn protease